MDTKAILRPRRTWRDLLIELLFPPFLPYNKQTKYGIWITWKSITLVQPIVKEEKKAEEEQWTQKPFLGHDGLEEIF